MQVSENTQQVCAVVAPAKARNLLSKVKKDRTVLRNHLELSSRKQSLLSAKCHCNEEKMVNLKRLNNQLMVDLLQEEGASNKIIDESMIEARQLSAKALDMMTRAHKFMQMQKCASQMSGAVPPPYFDKSVLIVH